MPRKSEIQAEETVASSPLRRSSRINVTTNGPSTLSATKNLQSAIEASEVKGVKTRRASLSQENTNKDEKKENKPMPRGRRGSTARDEPEQKPEPTKLRTRRSSANTEPVTKIEETKSAEVETPRQLRSRRSSVTDKPIEENTDKGNVKGKKTMSKEDSINDGDPVRKPIRSRRSSYTDKSEDPINVEEEKEKKRPTRGRRASTDKVEDEPEPKSLRLTPSKSKRRLSVTDNAVNLEPIEEQESEIKDRKSISPEKADLKVVLTTLSPNNETSEENKQPSNETRNVRLTPVKSRRRQSVTEKPINLEPIEEQELETKGRNSKSPSQTKLKVVLSPVLTDTELAVPNTNPKVDGAVTQPDFNSSSQLKTSERESYSSPIREGQIEHKSVRSPSENSEEATNTTSLNKEALHEIRSDSNEIEESIKTECPVAIVENDGNFVLTEEETETIQVAECSSESELDSHSPSKKSQPKDVTSRLNLSVIEEKSFMEASSNSDKPDGTSPKNSPRLHKNVKSSPETPRKSPRLMKQIARAEEKKYLEIDESVKIELEDETCNDTEESEDNRKTSTLNDGKCVTLANDLIATKIPCEVKASTEITEQIDSCANLEQDIKDETDIDPSTKTDCPNISIGSDGSFRFHLNTSLPSTNSEHTSQRGSIDEADEMNTSKTSNTSDKENRELNIPDMQTGKQAEQKLIQITNTIADSDSIEEKSQDVIVARVSNVFRPKMREISFVEPMEVDEYSYIQDTTIDKLPSELNKTGIENNSPTKSTPIAARKSAQFNKLENETRKQSIEEGDSVDESFKLNLSISNIGEEKLDVDNIKEESLANTECAEDPQEQDLIDLEETEEIPLDISVPNNPQSKSAEDLLKSDQQNRDRKESPPSSQQQNNVNEIKLDEYSCLNIPQVDSEQTTPLIDKVMLRLEDSMSPVKNPSLKIVDEAHEIVSKSDKDQSPSPLKDTEGASQQENPNQTEELEYSAEGTSEAVHTLSNTATDNFDEEAQELNDIQAKENKLHCNESDHDLSENEDGCSQSPKRQKLDASDEYEFDIPSEEEDIEQTEKEKLENNDNNEICLGEDRTSSPLKEKLINNEDIASINIKQLDISKNKESDAESSNISKCKSNEELNPQNVEKTNGDDKVAPQNESMEVGFIHVAEQLLTDSEFHIIPVSMSSEEKVVEEMQNNQEEVEVGITFVGESENSNQNNSENTEFNKEAAVTDSQFIEGNIIKSKVITEIEMDEAVADVDEMVNDFRDITKDDKEVNSTEIEEKSRKYEKLLVGSKDAQMNEVDMDKNEETGEGTTIQNTTDFLQQSIEYTDRETSENLVESIKTPDSVKITNKKQKKTNKKIKTGNYKADDSIENSDTEELKIDKGQITSKVKKPKKSKRIDEIVNKSDDSESNKDEQSLMENSIETGINTNISNHTKSINPCEVSNDQMKFNLCLATKSNKEHMQDSNIESVDVSKKYIETDKIAGVKIPMKKHKKKTKCLVENENDELDINVKSEKSHVAQDTRESTNTGIDVQTPRQMKNKKVTNIENFSESALDKYLLKKFSELDNENNMCNETSEGQEEESDWEEEESDQQSEESDQEENEFVCTMAEEGEEDTPSEGSNDIIDEGESINSTESEIDSGDEYDSNDSFICDDAEGELLSGDEYDLGDEHKKKKSRIIQLKDCDDDIIKIKRKEKPVKKKKSRIITIVDSSESEEEEQMEQDRELIENVEPIFQNVEQSADPDNEPVEILQYEELEEAEYESPILLETNTSTTSTNENEDRSRKSKRKSSITIHENINVKEIKDAALSERISSLVDTFCTSMQRGEISMNLSLEYAVKDSSEGSSQACEDIVEEIRETKLKTPKRHNKSSSVSDETLEAEGKITKHKRLRKKLRKSHIIDQESDSPQDLSSQRTDRLSVTLDEVEESDETEKIPSKKRRLSKSLENFNQVLPKKKSKNEKRWKKELVSKKKVVSPKISKSNKKQSPSSKDDLKAQTYSIMNQLITDVKKRPVRTIVPSKAVTDMNNSWITEVANVKPSTTIITKRDRTEHKLKTKIHPKDFRSQMLYDSSRVKRVDTKTLLRKKGAYF